MKTDIFVDFLDKIKDEDPTLIESVKSAFLTICEASTEDWDTYLSQQHDTYYGSDSSEYSDYLEKEYGKFLGYASHDMFDKVIEVYEHGAGTPIYVPGHYDADEDGKYWVSAEVKGFEPVDTQLIGDTYWITSVGGIKTQIPVFKTEQEAIDNQ